MSTQDSPTPADADWIRGGRGNGPALGWSFTAEGMLTALALAREAGEVFVADDTGLLGRLDRRGRIAAINRLHDPVRSLAWSDDGRFGVGICGEATVHFFDHVLQSQWKLELPEQPLSVAIAPFGTHLLISCVDGSNRIYDASRKRVAAFESMRPLAFAEFIATEPGIIVCAEHGLISRYDLQGRQIWTDKLWSNVGQLSIAGDGSLIYLACFTHGVQVYSGEGETVGSYVLDGTVSRSAVSFEPQRIIAATIERSLFWLDADGELLWTTSPPDTIEALECDPLGEWIICGLKCGRVLRLDWTAGVRPASDSES